MWGRGFSVLASWAWSIRLVIVTSGSGIIKAFSLVVDI
jgi:hypothetical protein